jgi:hypothetical protein
MKLNLQGKNYLNKIMYYDIEFADEIAEKLRNIFIDSKITVKPYIAMGPHKIVAYKQIWICWSTS